MTERSVRRIVLHFPQAFPWRDALAATRAGTPRDLNPTRDCQPCPRRTSLLRSAATIIRAIAGADR